MSTLVSQVQVSIKADLYELGAPDVSGFPTLDTDDARLIVAAFGKDGPPVAAKRLTVKGQPFPVIVELTVNDLAFPLTKARDYPSSLTTVSLLRDDGARAGCCLRVFDHS